MKSWLEFEERFRRLAPSLQYQRIDFTSRTDGESWLFCGGATTTAANQFNALAELAGLALADVANTYSELKAVASKESEPKHIWYRALKELTREFKERLFGYSPDENGSPKRHFVISSIENICEASANLCLMLQGKYPMPNKELPMPPINITR